MSGDLPTFIGNWIALAPLAWLMVQIYRHSRDVGWWATLFFTLPVYIMRVALRQVIEVREMFTQTIGALAQAVDARDTYTSGHSERVQLISVDIGQVLKLKDRPSSRRSSGAASCTTSARSAFRTACCSSRTS